MDDEDRPWLGEEPSARPDPTFHPVPTGLGVFTAIAVPVVVYGVTRAGGADGAIIALGILAGIVAGLLVAYVIVREGGHPPGRGPRF